MLKYSPKNESSIVDRITLLQDAVHHFHRKHRNDYINISLRSSNKVVSRQKYDRHPYQVVSQQVYNLLIKILYKLSSFGIKNEFEFVNKHIEDFPTLWCLYDGSKEDLVKRLNNLLILIQACKYNNILNLNNIIHPSFQ